MLEKAGIEVEVINAVSDPDMARKYGVKQAPTLVATDGDKFDKYAGVAAIKSFIDKGNVNA